MTLPDPPTGWRLAVLDFFNAPENPGYVILHRIDYHRARVSGEVVEVSDSGMTVADAMKAAIRAVDKLGAMA